MSDITCQGETYDAVLAETSSPILAAAKAIEASDDAIRIKGGTVVTCSRGACHLFFDDGGVMIGGKECFTDFFATHD